MAILCLERYEVFPKTINRIACFRHDPAKEAASQRYLQIDDAAVLAL